MNAYNKNSILFILGAGASVDSGLKTYRGTNGTYENDTSYAKLLSLDTLRENPGIIWKYYAEFYRDILCAKVTNSTTYSFIRDTIMPIFSNSIIITQNIDGFVHQTECTTVVELHGNVNYMLCEICGTKIEVDFENRQCQNGHVCRPFVVLFGESLWQKMEQIKSIIKHNRPNYLIVIGTTLQFPYLMEIIKFSKIPHANRYFIDTDKNTLLSIRTNWKNNKSRKHNYWQMSAIDGLSKFMTMSTTRQTEEQPT